MVKCPTELCTRCHFTVPSNQGSDFIQFRAGWTNNNVPSEEEAKQIAQSLPQAVDKLAVYDAELERIRSLLGSLETERSELARSITTCREVMKTSIHHLPPETLMDIFTWCQDSSDRTVSITRSDGQTPVRLSHVSSKWRAAAVSLPSLWSYIPIIVSRSDNIHVNHLHIQRLTQLYLQRSKNAPLTIRLVYDEDHPLIERDCRLLSGTVLSLITESHRWREVDFRLYTADLGTMIPAPMGGPLHNLEMLRFETMTSRGALFQSILWPLPSAPRLRNLHLEGLPVNLNDPKMRESLVQVTSVTMCHYFADEIHSVLQGLPAVEDLHVKEGAHRNTTPLQTHVFENLRSLKTETTRDSRQLIPFLRSLDLPRLQSFELIDNSPSTRPHAVLSNIHFVLFLGQNNRSLTSLILRGITISQNCWIEAFMRLSALTHLTIHEDSPSFVKEFFEDLNPSSAPFLLLKKLAHIDIGFKGRPNGQVQAALVEMCRARWRPKGEAVARLERIAITIPGGVLTQDSRELLIRMKAEGLKVHINETNPE
ncbi:hypothetical protein VNI00_008141 [Paramarasmius palmivorus]|uniref:F-box domain-containing protein n=1 Tax=Paramarasmius palmivorus TaxID=297713 RepID=A0AAW0CYB9_9AGAR